MLGLGVVVVVVGGYGGGGAGDTASTLGHPGTTHIGLTFHCLPSGGMHTDDMTGVLMTSNF